MQKYNYEALTDNGVTLSYNRPTDMTYRVTMGDGSGPCACDNGRRYIIDEPFRND